MQRRTIWQPTVISRGERCAHFHLVSSLTPSTRRQGSFCKQGENAKMASRLHHILIFFPFFLGTKGQQIKVLVVLVLFPKPYLSGHFLENIVRLYGTKSNIFINIVGFVCLLTLQLQILFASLFFGANMPKVSKR